MKEKELTKVKVEVSKIVTDYITGVDKHLSTVENKLNRFDVIEQRLDALLNGIQTLALRLDTQSGIIESNLSNVGKIIGACQNSIQSQTHEIFEIRKLIESSSTSLTTSSKMWDEIKHKVDLVWNQVFPELSYSTKLTLEDVVKGYR